MSKRVDGFLHEALTYDIIRAFFEVYNELGHGLLESVYAAALAFVLRGMGHEVQTEVGVTVYFRGHAIARQRIDMLVDGLVVVEIKSTQELPKTATRQLYNYLKATKLEVGLLLHFGPDPRFLRLVSSNKS